MGRITIGDKGGGGLAGGTVAGLNGMWKYLVVLGKSTVAIGAIHFMCVGG
jgi:hypothetical protein